MDRITPSQTSSLIEALRKLGKSSKEGSVRVTPTTESSKIEPSTLREELSALIAGVDIESDTGLREIQIPVLRCILQDQWGRQASDDPVFANVVDALNQSFSKDPRLIKVIRDALRALQATKG